MSPSRRQTLVGIAGVAVGTGAYGYGRGDGDETERHVETALATAEAVYPSTVSVDESFIRKQVFGRREPLPGHFEGLRDALDTVDGYARSRYGRPMAALSEGTRLTLLRDLGVDSVRASPDGTRANRIRYYLVHDLLFALITSPEGTALHGIESPPGVPGGRDVYRLDPNDV